jgi:hypothetical protein
MMVEDSCNMFMSFLEFDETGNEHLEYLDCQSDYFLKRSKTIGRNISGLPRESCRWNGKIRKETVRLFFSVTVFDPY